MAVVKSADKVMEKEKSYIVPKVGRYPCRYLFLVFFIFCINSFGCVQVETPPECRLSSDCPLNEQCIEGRCLAECREDRDCAASETCADKKCIAKIPPARVCQFARQCMENETCRAGICEEVSLQGSDLEPYDAGVPVGNDGGTMGQGLPYGAVCSAASECASGFCLGATGEGRCTVMCSTNSDCVYPDQCIDVPNSGRFCGVLPTAGATGSPCSSPDDCESGICITPDNVCTRECSGFSSCPTGMTCQPIDTGMGSAITLCVVGNGSGFGAPCARASECFSQLCVGVPATGAGVCTAMCDQIPCPLGWSCTTVPNGSGGNARVCALEGQSAGGFGASCQQAADCTNGLCLNDSRSMSSFCTIPCSANSDCASVPGLLCVTLQGGQTVCGPQ